jgi:hypothetical protein
LKDGETKMRMAAAHGAGMHLAGVFGLCQQICCQFLEFGVLTGIPPNRWVFVHVSPAHHLRESLLGIRNNTVRETSFPFDTHTGISRLVQAIPPIQRKGLPRRDAICAGDVKRPEEGFTAESGMQVHPIGISKEVIDAFGSRSYLADRFSRQDCGAL